MSALAEVDLRDFERVDVDALERVLVRAEQEHPWSGLGFSIEEYCYTLRRIQKKLIQQTPALFKPKA